jgi:4-carboxymuconolactone decarboxylase
LPRITPIADKAEVPSEYQHVVDGVLEVFGNIRGPHSILLHRPQLDEPALALGNYFRYNSVVKSPQRELAVITAAREKDCLYVWAAQVGAGRRAGLSEDAIAAVKSRGDVSGLPANEAAIVSYVRQLYGKNRVDQQTFDAIKDAYGIDWLIEMTALVGYYGMLAGVVNAMELPGPPDGDVLPV